jgi:hypothetical protein
MVPEDRLAPVAATCSRRSRSCSGWCKAKPFHPGDQIRLGRLDHQMKMIRHEDVSVNPFIKKTRLQIAQSCSRKLERLFRWQGQWLGVA